MIRLADRLALAVVTGAALAATLIDPQWIEATLRVDPDAGSGAFEWAIVLALASAFVASAVGSWRSWRRLGTVEAAG